MGVGCEVGDFEFPRSQVSPVSHKRVGCGGSGIFKDVESGEVQPGQWGMVYLSYKVAKEGLWCCIMGGLSVACRAKGARFGALGL